MTPIPCKNCGKLCNGKADPPLCRSCATSVYWQKRRTGEIPRPEMTGICKDCGQPCNSKRPEPRCPKCAAKLRAQARKGNGPKHIPPKTFIKAWQTSESAEEAAGKLGISPSRATNTAVRYRKNGVPLKKMYIGRKAPSWQDLAEYAKSLEDQK